MQNPLPRVTPAQFLAAALLVTGACGTIYNFLLDQAPPEPIRIHLYEPGARVTCIGMQGLRGFEVSGGETREWEVTKDVSTVIFLNKQGSFAMVFADGKATRVDSSGHSDISDEPEAAEALKRLGHRLTQCRRATFGPRLKA